MDGLRCGGIGGGVWVDDDVVAVREWRHGCFSLDARLHFLLGSCKGGGSSFLMYIHVRSKDPSSPTIWP